jgi:hypothetical protein
MIPTFPQSISLTITNHCNLRCQMCGQWSQEGYVRGNPERLKHEMTLAEWKRVVDDAGATCRGDRPHRRHAPDHFGRRTGGDSR